MNLYMARDLDDRGYSIWVGNEPPKLDLNESHLYHRQFTAAFSDCILMFRIPREPIWEQMIQGNQLEEGQCIRLQRLVIIPPKTCPPLT